MVKILKFLTNLCFLSLIIGPLGKLPFESMAISIYFIDLTVIALSIFWICNLNRLIYFIRGDKLTTYFSLFWFALLVSHIFSPLNLTIQQHAISLLYLLRYGCYWVIYISFSYLLKQKILTKENILNRLIWIGVCLGILGGVQYILYPDLRNLYYLGWDPHLSRIFSTYLDPNYFGLVMVLVMLAVLYSRFSLLLKAGFGTFLFIILAFTYSRSSYLCFLSTNFIHTLLARRIKLYIAILTGFFIVLFLLPRGQGEGVKLERVFSLEKRVESWKLAGTFLVKYPLLGIGFNNTRFAKQLMNIDVENLDTSHSAAGFDNSFLFILATSGTVGFVFFLSFIYTLLSLSGRWGQLSIVGVLIHSMFLNSIFFSWTVAWLWIVAAADMRVRDDT